MATDAPQLLHYTDYRVFLKDWYSWAKENRRGFSYRQFAAKSETSPSLLKDIIDSRRNLSETTAPKFAHALGLTATLSDYFLWMVRFRHAPNQEQASEAFSHMARHRTRAKMRYLNPEEIQFLSQWHHLAIREMVALPDFQADPQWIAKHLNPPISAPEATSSWKLLQNLKLVQKNPEGKWIASDAALTTDWEIRSMAAREYHRQCLQLANRALDSIPTEEREISGLVVSCSEQMMHRIQDRLRIFKEELLHMVIEEQAPAERIYQIDVQIFPISEKLPENQ